MSTKAFDDLAETYQTYRPDYPDAVLAAVRDAWKEGVGALKVAADVGAGTGISTRALARVLGGGWRIVGLEPNRDMLAKADRRETKAGKVEFRSGDAEHLPFADASLGIVAAAQSAHWFDRPLFYGEAGRVLARGGCLAILNNNRQLDGPGLMGRFEALMEREIAGYDRHYRDIDFAAELRRLTWPERTFDHAVAWQRRLSPEGFAGLMMSRSKLKPFTVRRGESGARDILVRLARDFAEDDGGVTIHYVARAHIAVKG